MLPDVCLEFTYSSYTYASCLKEKKKKNSCHFRDRVFYFSGLNKHSYITSVTFLQMGESITIQHIAVSNWTIKFSKRPTAHFFDIKINIKHGIGLERAQFHTIKVIAMNIICARSCWIVQLKELLLKVGVLVFNNTSILKFYIVLQRFISFLKINFTQKHTHVCVHIQVSGVIFCL